MAESFRYHTAPMCRTEAEAVEKLHEMGATEDIRLWTGPDGTIRGRGREPVRAEGER